MIDQYEIIKLIYKDELGGLYLAKDNILPREVYFRNFDSSADGTSSAQNWKKQFLLHAKEITAIKHPNILSILDFFIDEEDPILISEVIDADFLSEYLDKGAFSVTETLRMAKDILSALSVAHAAGLYHGAMHTASIKVIPTANNFNQYKIIDLGIKSLSSFINEIFFCVNDPILLPPESYEIDFKPNASSDLFMVGQLCYTVLAGGHPFANHTWKECADAYKKGETPPLTTYNTNVPENLRNWITQLIHPQPAKRYLSAKEALTNLKELEKHSPPTPEKKIHTPTLITTHHKTSPKIFIGIAILLVLSAIACFLILKPRPEEKKTHYDSITLGEVTVLNKIKKSPVSISLNDPNIIDWFVTTGGPVAESNRRKENGGHFINITKIGSFKAFRQSNTPVNFILNQKQLPSGSATSNRHNAKKNNGWEIILKNPQSQNQSITLNLYITQTNCDLSVSLASIEKSSSSPINFDIPYTKSGIVKIPIHIPKIPPKKIFTLSILSKKIKPKENFTIGLNAITIENL